MLAVLLLCVGAFAAHAPLANAAAIEEVTGFGSNPGTLRMFRYTPDGLPSGRPVVVALHGCSQDAVGYGTKSGWTAMADRERFTLVLPHTDTGNNLLKCFNWFEPGDTGRDRGEAASIIQMTRRAVADAGADASRVFVTGLSAGGAMTAVMLATYPDEYRGGAIVAGLPYGCAANSLEATSCMLGSKNLTPAQWADRVRTATDHNGPWPTVSVYHGSLDFTVSTTNQRELVEQWTAVHGTDTTSDGSDTVFGYPHNVFRDGSGNPVVETYTITGMAHGQPVNPGSGDGHCGTADTFGFYLSTNLCAAWQIATDWSLGS